MLRQFSAAFLLSVIHFAASAQPTFCKEPWTEPPAGRGAPKKAQMQTPATPGKCINGYWVSEKSRYCSADERSVDPKSVGGVYNPKEKACMNGYLLGSDMIMCYDINGTNGKPVSAHIKNSCKSGKYAKPVFE